MSLLCSLISRLFGHREPAPAAAEPQAPVRHMAHAADEAAPGTPGTGEGLCPGCSGKGRKGAIVCPECGGSGVVVQGIGGG